MLRLKMRVLRLEGLREPGFVNLEDEGEGTGYET
jgi:hypothetical protein